MQITAKVLLVAFFTCSAVMANAFSFPPKRKGPKSGHVGAPFDGGVTLLVAAGLAYGLKKAYDRRKDSRPE